MAEAARTVKYHVSDFLKDRYPYNRAASFESQRERDAGQVFDGFGKFGLDQLLANLVDPAIDTHHRALALRHILAHSASAETKVVLIRKNAIGLLAGVATSKKSASPLVESLVHQVLRSLCVIPQGCVAVLEEGGLGVLLSSLNARGNDDRNEARLQAAAAIAQIASSDAGRSWLLNGNTNPPAAAEYELSHRKVAVLTDAQRAEASNEVVQTLVSVLTKDGAKQPLLLRQAAQALSSLCSVTAGRHKALIAGCLREVTQLLGHYANNLSWLAQAGPEVDAVTALSTVAWYAGLDPVGLKEALEQPTLLPSVGILIHGAAKHTGVTHFSMLSALAGAMGAMVLHPDLKGKAIEPIRVPHVRIAASSEDASGDGAAASAEAGRGGGAAELTTTTTIVDTVIEMLTVADGLAAQLLAAKKAGRPPPFLTPSLTEVASLIKNCVQTVRLVAEMPKVRAVLHERLPNDDERSEKVRRMVFYCTAWQEEFNVRVY